MTKESAVTVIEPELAGPPVVQHEPVVSLLQVIERAATNPAVDVDKMERLMAMHERILARDAKAAYNAALSEMQPKLPAITERGEIKHNDKLISRYARLEDIMEAITPVLGQHGFALSFRSGRDGDSQIVTGILSHRDGHSESDTMILPRDMSGSKNAVQGVGSTVSYGKRYVTQSLLNLVSRGEDDDGQAAGAGDVISAEQKETLIALLRETDSNTEKFLKYLNVESLDKLKASNFERAKKALEAKRKAA